MKPFSIKIASLLAATLLASATWAAPAIIVNASNADEIDSDMITSALVGKRKFWESGSEVVIAVLKGDPESSKALEEHAKMDEGRFRNHWQRLAFSGRGRMPKMFDDADELLDFVRDNAGAIAVVGGEAGDSPAVRKVN